MLRARAIFGIVCVGCAACALVTDLGDLAGTGGDAGNGAVCDAGGTCAAVHVPTGWSPIAFHEGFVGCPAGFTSQKFVTGPVASCSCGCKVATEPDCTSGSIATTFGTTSACSQPGATSAVDGGCKAVAGTISAYFGGTPIAPAGATCTAEATPDASTTSAEACLPNQCGDSICEGIVPPGFRACILGLGDQPCPSGTPFSVATRVGATTNVTCGAGCGCAVAASCQSGTFEFYSDGVCATKLTTVAVNGTCVPTGQAPGTAIGSLKYTATASASCTVSGASSADASLADVHTVCCAP